MIKSNNKWLEIIAGLSGTVHDTFTINLEPVPDPFTAGSVVNFQAESDNTADESFVIHIKVNDDDSFSADMLMDGFSSGTYEWTTYYDAPFGDVDDVITVWVTGNHNSNPSTSNEISFTLV